MNKDNDILQLTNFVTTNGTKNNNSFSGDSFNTQELSNNEKNKPIYKKGDKVYYITKGEVIKVFNYPNEEPYYLVKLNNKREINTIEKRLILRKIKKKLI